MQANRWPGRILVTGQFVLFAGILIAPGGDPWPAGVSLVARVVSPFAFIAAAIAFWSLGKARSAHPIPNSEATFITGGWYQWCRHPVYSFLLCGFAASAVAAGGILKLGLVFGLWVWFEVKSRYEESWLAHKFVNYSTYAQEVGRFTRWTGRWKSGEHD